MIHWLIQTSGDVPENDDWLCERERQRFAALKTPKRRDDWLLGRWTAKQLVCAVLPGSLEPQDVEIRSLPDGSPQAYVAGSPRFSLSISHSHGWACCALAEAGALGADLERVEHRIPEFVDDYFTQAELDGVRAAADADLMTTAIWSAKEAALKALRLGLTVDTRAVRCLVHALPVHGWASFEIVCDAARLPRTAELGGWWQIVDLGGAKFVLTLAVEGASQRSGAKNDERYGLLH